jgi:hypothetical protein
MATPATYHPDPAINAEVAQEALESDVPISPLAIRRAAGSAIAVPSTVAVTS